MKVHFSNVSLEFGYEILVELSLAGTASNSVQVLLPITNSTLTGCIPSSLVVSGFKFQYLSFLYNNAFNTD